jgi:predicted Zn-dependent protease
MAIASCQQHSPYSKWQSYTRSDDKLSDKEKIDLFMEGSNVLSATGLAAVAGLYEKQKAWNPAMLTIQQAIEADPMNSSFHSLKAKYAFELGQKSMAYQEALTAYQLGSKSIKQSLDLAKMAVALSEFKIVNDIIDSLLMAYPDDEIVLYMSARKYDKSNNTALANEYYGKVYQINSENWENTIFYSRFLIRANDFERAKNILHQIVPEKSSRVVRLLQGDTYFGLNQFDSAAYFYELALHESSDTVTYNKIIASYKLAKNNDGLMRIGRSAASDFPQQKQYLLITARVLDKKYQFEEALPYYISLYELDTLDTLVQAELAYLQRKIAYLHRKRREERQLADSLSREDSEEN